jgi:hypothetical protein
MATVIAGTLLVFRSTVGIHEDSIDRPAGDVYPCRCER